jgi:hypothetical protein
MVASSRNFYEGSRSIQKSADTISNPDIRCDRVQVLCKNELVFARRSGVTADQSTRAIS